MPILCVEPLQQLLELGESGVHSMAILEHEWRRRKAFVDRHRQGNENAFKICQAVLVFQTPMGKMLVKLWFWWTGPYWITNVENDTFKLRTLADEILRQKINGFRV